MTVFQTALLIFLIYLCVYSIVNRICKCVEHCATGRAYTATVDKEKNDVEENNR